MGNVVKFFKYSLCVRSAFLYAFSTDSCSIPSGIKLNSYLLFNDMRVNIYFRVIALSGAHRISKACVVIRSVPFP